MINHQTASSGYGLPTLGTVDSVYELCVVVYRTGGTANFKWHRTLAMSQEIAIRTAADTVRMGYACFVDSYVSSKARGLPTTYEG